MRMARLNVYLPDDLAREARDAGLNVSGLTQAAVRSALAATATNDWLDSLARLPRPGVTLTHGEVLAAVRDARDEFERAGG